MSWAGTYGAWAENPRTMIRLTIGLAVFDEIDNCAEAAGGLGNTLELLGERIVTYGYRGKIIANGTPTTAEASGWRMLQQSDHRRPYVPCPACGGYQVLAFDRIKLRAGQEQERDPDRIEHEQLAGYECEHCQTWLPHKESHRWMIDRVTWIPRGQEPAGKLDIKDAGQVGRARTCGPPGWVQWTPPLKGEPPKTRIRGYWINVLYSPWPSRTWSHIFARFLRVKDERDKLRVFINSWLAQPWQDSIEVTSADSLLARRKESHYQMGYVPAEAKIMLLGADVQLDHIYYAMRAFGPRETSWLIHHGTLETFDALYELAFLVGFPVLGHPGRLIRCNALAIDSNYRTDEVYEFGARPGVMICRGAAGHPAYRTRTSNIEWQPKGSPHVLTRQLHLINTALFKAKVHRLAKLPLDQPGAWHLPRDCDEDYIRQFVAEHQVMERPRGKRQGSPRLVWRPRTEGAANHYLDCEVYLAALADISRVALLREMSPVVGVMEEPKAPERRQPKAGDAGGFGGGYL